MYKPKNTTLSADSYQILNTIRENVGGEFRAMTPLVENEQSMKAYGEYVCGGGDAANVFMSALWNRIAQVMCLGRSYQNPLKDFKRGILGFGEVVENVWIGLVLPEGFTQSVANPGDVYATNNPENMTSFHPVNSKLVYETTVNESELELAFTSESGVYDLVQRIVQRMYDSTEWDEYILMKYTIARAILNNKQAIRVTPTLNAENSDSVVSAMKEISNDMRFMSTGFNEMSVPTHTPINEQVFFLTSKSSAIIDVSSLAAAYNIEYKQFLGQQVMVNNFTFNDDEQNRLDHLMSETVKIGLIPNYTPFTEEEKTILANIIGATIDRDFFMIFDKILKAGSVYDPKHGNTNTFLIVWKIFSHNPFANAVFFSDTAVANA